MLHMLTAGLQTHDHHGRERTHQELRGAVFQTFVAFAKSFFHISVQVYFLRNVPFGAQTLKLLELELQHSDQIFDISRQDRAIKADVFSDQESRRAMKKYEKMIHVLPGCRA